MTRKTKTGQPHLIPILQHEVTFAMVANWSPVYTKLEGVVNWNGISKKEPPDRAARQSHKP